MGYDYGFEYTFPEFAEGAVVGLAGLMATVILLFLLSDVSLMAYMFYSPLRLFWVLCIYVYWPAQLLLAWALLHYAEENKRQRVHINTIRVNYKI